MNIKLVQDNLKEIQKQAELGNTVEAARITMAVVKLLLRDPAEGEGQMLYIAFSGMAAALKRNFEILLETYKPSSDIEIMQQALKEVNDQIADYAEKAESVEKANQDLLAAGEKLRAQKQELCDLRKKVAELIQIRDQELKDLGAEIDKKKADLEALKESCRQARAEREKWLQVFDVNNQLIADLPESVADRTVDGLIAQAKAYRDQAQANAEQGEEYLRRVVEALGAVKRKLEGAN